MSNILDINLIHTRLPQQEEIHHVGQMAPPLYVQAVIGAVQMLFLVIGLRDIVATGTPLPLPDEAKLMMVFKASADKYSSAVFRSEGAMLFFGQMLGTFILTVAVAKLTLVFTNTTEGTYLRRNLFVAFGMTDLLAAGILFGRDSFFIDNFDVSVKPFIGLMVIEGLVLLVDAFFRPRPRRDQEDTRKKKKAK